MNPSEQPTAIAKFIRELPKAEIHVHLEGLCRSARVYLSAEENDVATPIL